MPTNDKLHIGLPTYNNAHYTKMALDAIKDTGIPAYLVLVNGAGDAGNIDVTEDWFESGHRQGHTIMHMENRGLPAALNDIMDSVFKDEKMDMVLWLGNDVIPYPDALRNLLDAASLHPNFDCYVSREMTSRCFIARYPQYRSDFDEDMKLKKFPFTGYLKHWDDITRQPVRLHRGVRTLSHTDGFHNFTLMRRSFFEKVGYVDANFYPAYYEDLDYVRRGQLAGMKMAEAVGSWYFHFHSSTAREVHGEKAHQRYFALNDAYYRSKWGGPPGAASHDVPFAGTKKVNIHVRSEEKKDVEFWKWTPLEFRNKHAGQRCIIAANGPGLNDIDMSLLKNEIVFGLNRFQLKTDMPVTYGVATNRLLLDQFGADIALADCEALFIPRIDAMWRPHTYGLILDGGPPRFAKDASQSMFEGYTVNYVALQLAFYMGFDPVIQIGLDHKYEFSGAPNALLQSIGADPNHFDPDYFGKGTMWQAPDLEKSRESYIMAQAAYSMAGRRIINCSTRSELDVFERADLKEVLNAKRK